MNKKKVVPVYNKDDKMIAAKADKEDVMDDFDSYYDNMCKLLKEDSLKVEHYDENQIIMYKNS
jgi:hypothetical protein